MIVTDRVFETIQFNLWIELLDNIEASWFAIDLFIPIEVRYRLDRWIVAHLANSLTFTEIVINRNLIFNKWYHVPIKSTKASFFTIIWHSVTVVKHELEFIVTTVLGQFFSMLVYVTFIKCLDIWLFFFLLMNFLTNYLL